MPDKLTQEQRHRCMASIRGKDTKPEMLVRRWLHSRGFRYRVNVKGLPGSPDIVLRKYRTVIFIHGCFWHGHDCRNVTPSANADFWNAKRAYNKQHDDIVTETLTRKNWTVIRIWECELKKKNRELLLEKISILLRG